MHQDSIRFARLRGKARECSAQVRTVERGVFVDLSRKKTSSQRAKWNKTDSEFLQRRQYLLFRLSPPQRIFVLHCRHRLHCMCATDGLHSWLRKTEVLDLSFLNHVLHRSRHIFYRHIGIDTMLVEQIDDVAPESLQRSFGDLLDVLWPAIQADLLTFRTNFETEFGGYHYLLAERSKRFAHKFFVCKRAVHFGGIEKRYAEFYGFPKKRDHLLLVLGRAVAKAHSHTAQADGRHFQITLSKFPLLHF